MNKEATGGQEFDPSQEPVTSGTIRAIMKECKRIYTTEAEVVRDERYGYVYVFKDSRRESYSKDGRVVHFDNRTVKSVSNFESGEIHVGDSDFNVGSNRYDITITEELTDTTDPKSKPTKVRYQYAASYGRSNFLLLYLLPSRGKWWEMENNLSPLEKQRAQELLSQGVTVGRLFMKPVWSEQDLFSDSPIYAVIKPTGGHARRLLVSLKSIEKVRVFADKLPL